MSVEELGVVAAVMGREVWPEKAEKVVGHISYSTEWYQIILMPKLGCERNSTCCVSFHNHVFSRTFCI